MNKKLFTVFMPIIVLLLALALTACAQQQEAPGGGDTALAVDTTPAADDTAAVAAPGDNFNPTGMPIVNEMITLTVMQGIRDIDNIDLTDNWFVDYLEEMTNIRIDYIPVTHNDWDLRLNLMMAAGDFPDIIKSGGASVDVVEYGVIQGILIPLEGLIEQYMPILHERMQSDTAVWQNLIQSDGHIYGLPQMQAQGLNTLMKWFINQTWLDIVGMDTPRTVNELTEVLRAFRDQQPHGGNEIPFTADFSHGNAGVLPVIMPFWGIPYNDQFVVLEDDESVSFIPFMPGFREALEWAHMLFAEGLLDPDFLTQDANLFRAKLYDANVGFFGEWRLTVMGFDPIAEHAVLMYPVSADGFTARSQRTTELANQNAFVTIANEQIPETMRWFDAQFEPTTMMNGFWGPRGIAWEYTEDGLMTSSADLTIVNTYSLGVNGLSFAPAEFWFSTVENPPHRVEKFEYSERYIAAGVLQTRSNSLLTHIARFEPDEMERRTHLRTNLLNAIEEFTASFIMNGVTDARWDEFMSALHAIGAEEYVAIWQAGYDRTFR